MCWAAVVQHRARGGPAACRPCASTTPAAAPIPAGQLRNLEKALGESVRLCDRTALILDIFSQRAATREGKLQASGKLLPWFRRSRRAAGRCIAGPGSTWTAGIGASQAPTVLPPPRHTLQLCQPPPLAPPSPSLPAWPGGAGSVGVPAATPHPHVVPSGAPVGVRPGEGHGREADRGGPTPAQGAHGAAAAGPG
jgi:hypothetical protein